MQKCCDREIESMQRTGRVATPYYIERVAVLCRKRKNYADEVLVCERYVNAVDAHYREHGAAGVDDVRRGARYLALVARLARARVLATERTGNPGSSRRTTLHET